jgi:hypothetical protein
MNTRFWTPHFEIWLRVKLRLTEACKHAESLLDISEGRNGGSLLPVPVTHEFEAVVRASHTSLLVARQLRSIALGFYFVFSPN